jgi:hypothetical protein
MNVITSIFRAWKNEGWPVRILALLPIAAVILLPLLRAGDVDTTAAADPAPVVETEVTEVETEVTEADDTIIEADVVGWDRDAMVEATEVCEATNVAVIEATDTAMVTLDVDWLYEVISTETLVCAAAMEDAAVTITDPELDRLWTEAIESGLDLAIWTGLGWDGTEADLYETLRLVEANADDWTALADWAATAL